MRGANRVAMFDLDSWGFMAGFAAYLQLSLRPNVSAIADSGGTIYRQLSWLGEDDLLLALCFPRYGRATVEACRYARRSGARAVALTGRCSSPGHSPGTEALLVRCERELLASSPTAVAGQEQGRAPGSPSEGPPADCSRRHGAREPDRGDTGMSERRAR